MSTNWRPSPDWSDEKLDPNSGKVLRPPSPSPRRGRLPAFARGPAGVRATDPHNWFVSRTRAGILSRIPRNARGQIDLLSVCRSDSHRVERPPHEYNRNGK